MKTNNSTTNLIRPASYWGTLSAIAAFNVFLLILSLNLDFKFDESTNVVAASRPFAFLILPVLASMFSRTAQDAIAHFRIKNILPGCRAVALASLDPRINLKKIKAGGRVPPQGIKQNAWWYTEFYQKVKILPEVVVAQRRYILFRDLAFFQGIALSIFALVSASQGGTAWWSLLVATILYGAFVLSTRNRGEQFVQIAMATEVAK